MLLSGILLTPTGEPYKNSLVRITANNTSEQVLQSVYKEFRTDVEGSYEIDVPNGWYSVSVLANRENVNIGNIEITDETTLTTINELLMLGQTAGSDPLVAQVASAAASAEASKIAAALSAEQATQGNPYNLVTWSYTQAFQLVSATRDSNGAIITASIVWPDGILGVFTTDIASVAFPGAIDAWHATYIGLTAKTITQPVVTRDSIGAVVIQPAIIIT